MIGGVGGGTPKLGLQQSSLEEGVLSRGGIKVFLLRTGLTAGFLAAYVGPLGRKFKLKPTDSIDFSSSTGTLQCPQLLCQR